jgi:2-amino-4-hydroxy-6-hydroxymethyldihydropteridine diphosphokinase
MDAAADNGPPRRLDVVAYIGLGSNQGDREGTLRAALAALAGIPAVSAVRASALRETAPWGETCRGQPPYLNAVAEIRTTLSPEALLRELQELERRFGRTRPAVWAPRTLDLDLLLYGDRVIRTPDLEVPHPRMASRRFVLEPLAELAPDLRLPGGARVADLLARAGDAPD